MPSFQFFDVILLAMVAGFIAFRLYSVLGRRTGNERSPEDRLRDQVTQPDAPRAAKTADFPTPSGGVGVLAGPVSRALMDIKLADRKFDADRFLAGARAAYEMIVTAYGTGDRETLKPLLSEDVYQSFDAGIAAREARNESPEFTFGTLKSARITGAAMKDSTAEITVTFESEGSVSGADATQTAGAQTVIDVWTFARDTSNRDPNWTLIATASGA
jgi:predicted lipid-binding transport protein (Tim44 family)